MAWLGKQPAATYLMGATTYRLMSGFAAGDVPAGQDEFSVDEAETLDELTRAPKVVFSASLEDPLTWANATLVRGDAVDAVRALKEDGSGLLSTIGSLPSTVRWASPRSALSHLVEAHRDERAT